MTKSEALDFVRLYRTDLQFSHDDLVECYIALSGQQPTARDWRKLGHIGIWARCCALADQEQS